MMPLPHFLRLSDLGAKDLHVIIKRAVAMKALQRRKACPTPLSGMHVILIFSKPSTRTRLSFEIGIRQLGGSAIFLSADQTQLGRGESITDTARVLSSMADMVVIRETNHDALIQFRDAASIPVINALSESAHPCQLLADMQTYHEHRGEIKDHIVLWLGDGNNMCKSYIEAAQLFGFQLRISTPKGFEPDQELPDCAQIIHDPREAAEGAQLLVTDTWHSMGGAINDQSQKKNLREKFADYQLNQELLSLAHKDAVYLHCLPAYRGDEISAELMDRPDSLIWHAAENRLHAQKALIELIAERI
jgi:ornithine carbamoyltransferase